MSAQSAKRADAIAPDRILQLGLAFWGAKALLSAVELGLFTELAAGPLDGESLRQELGLHPRSARDFFDALVALGMLDRDGDVYRNTQETATFLDRNKPGYVGGILEMANARLYPFWGTLTEGLQTGLPQNESKRGGKGLFEELYSDPKLLRQFLAGMTGLSLGAARAIAGRFPWAEYKTFVDVGCAQGGLPVELAKAHPHLKGIGFDLPVVGPIFLEYAAANGMSERLGFEGGDFFSGKMPSADVILMGIFCMTGTCPRKRC